MASVVTVKRVADGEITTRKVFQYPATAQAAANDLSDLAESKRLSGAGEYDVTCTEDAYSSPDDNALSIADALAIRQARICDDWRTANEIRSK